MFNLNKQKVITGILVCLLVAIASYYKAFRYSPEERAFTKIYERNIGVTDLASDPKGSGLYLQLLDIYVNKFDIKTVFDLGCGDWRLMSAIAFPDEKIYKGFDLVGSVINNNIQHYQKSNVIFHHIHRLADFATEKGDLLVVKDVIQHWPNEDIKYFIQNILPNFKYALITNDYDSPNFNQRNGQISHGGFRNIDLESEPFNLENIAVILDYNVHGLLKRVYLYTNPN
jgi:hypothetical protein